MVDVVREIKPPFSPEQSCKDFALLMKEYGISTVTSDKWAGQFAPEQFLKWGVYVKSSASAKSDLYRELLPILHSGKLELPDHARLIGQLGALERRVARGGRDSIDHPDHGHDDIANACAGAIVAAKTETRLARPGVF